jgi:protein arginine kinase
MEYSGFEAGRAWFLSDGPDFDVVLSSRVRMSANLPNIPFSRGISFTERRDILDSVTRWFARETDLGHWSYYALDELTNPQKGVLQERRFLSSRLNEVPGCGCFVNPEQDLSLVTGDEDHIRLTALRNGFDLDGCARAVTALHTRMDGAFSFVRDNRGNWLTARVSDYGTAVKITAFLQLTALVMTGAIDFALKDVMRRGLSVKGIFNEKLEPVGDLFQISNGLGYSLSSGEILETLNEAVVSLVLREREEREKLLSEKQNRLENMVFRSYGILRMSGTFTYQEALDQLSTLRFGLSNRILTGFPVRIFNSLMVLMQNNHLRVLCLKEKGKVDENDLGERRALFIKEMLGRYSA